MKTLYQCVLISALSIGFFGCTANSSEKEAADARATAADARANAADADARVTAADAHVRAADAAVDAAKPMRVFLRRRKLTDSRENTIRNSIRNAAEGRPARFARFKHQFSRRLFHGQPFGSRCEQRHHASSRRARKFVAVSLMWKRQAE